MKSKPNLHKGAAAGLLVGKQSVEAGSLGLDLLQTRCQCGVFCLQLGLDRFSLLQLRPGLFVLDLDSRQLLLPLRSSRSEACFCPRDCRFLGLALQLKLLDPARSVVVEQRPKNRPLFLPLVQLVGSRLKLSAASLLGLLAGVQLTAQALALLRGLLQGSLQFP